MYFAFNRLFLLYVIFLYLNAQTVYPIMLSDHMKTLNSFEECSDICNEQNVLQRQHNNQTIKLCVEIFPHHYHPLLVIVREGFLSKVITPSPHNTVHRRGLIGTRRTTSSSYGGPTGSSHTEIEKAYQKLLLIPVCKNVM